MESISINVVEYDYKTRKLVLNEGFIKKMKEKCIEKLVVITVNGQVGKGKSTFGSVLLNKLKWLEENKESDMFECCAFASSDASVSYTMGLNGYSDFLVVDGVGILLIDSEGLNGIIDGVDSEEVEAKLMKILSVSLLLSSVFIYLSPMRLENPDAQALINVQTRVELLRDKTKIDYPNIYFIISRTNQLILEDGTSNEKSSNFQGNSTGEINVTEQQEKALLDFLTKATRLNTHMRRNFHSNVFPQIDKTKINIKNPKEILLKDKIMDAHINNLICKFLNHKKTHPGTNQFMNSFDFADYLEKVVEAVNADKFDSLAVSLSNKLLDLKKKIKEEITEEMKVPIDPESIKDMKQLREATEKIEQKAKSLMKFLKKNIHQKMPEIKAEEEIHSAMHELKCWIIQLKVEKQEDILKKVYEPRKKFLEGQINELKSINQEHSQKSENTKRVIEMERQQFENTKASLKSEIERYNNEIKEKQDKIANIEKNNEILQSQINEIAQHEALYKFNQEEYDELKGRKKVLEDKLERYITEAKNMKNEKQRLENEIHINQRKLNDKKNENDENMEKYRKQSEKLESLKSENRKLMTDLRRLDEPISSNESEITGLKEKLKKTEDEIEKVKEKMNKLDKEDRLVEENRKSSLMLNLDVSPITVNPTQEIINKNTLIDERDELAERIKNLKQEIEDTKKEFNDYKEKYNEITKTNLEAKLQQMQKMHDEIIGGDMDKVVRDYQSEIECSKIKCQTLTNEIAMINEDIEKKKQLIQRRPEFIESKKALEIEAIRQEEIEKENERIKETLEAKREEKRQLETKYDQLKEESHEMEIKLDNLLKEIENYKIKQERDEKTRDIQAKEMELQLSNVQKRLDKAVETMNTSKVAYDEIINFIQIIKEFVKYFQELFTKLNSFEKSSTISADHYDQLLSVIFENFSDKPKILKNIKPMQNKGIDIVNECENLFKAIENLENHPCFKKGDIDKIVINIESENNSLESEK